MTPVETPITSNLTKEQLRKLRRSSALELATQWGKRLVEDCEETLAGMGWTLRLGEGCVIELTANDVAKRKRVREGNKGESNQAGKRGVLNNSSSSSSVDSVSTACERNQWDKIVYEPIGRMRSCFKTKYGAPRQGSVAHITRGSLTLRPDIPAASLDGIEE